MAPYTITHCINDDTSFVRESRHSRDIKYRILMNIKFYASQGVCLVKHILPKTIEFYLHIQVPNVTSKM